MRGDDNQQEGIFSYISPEEASSNGTSTAAHPATSLMNLNHHFADGPQWMFRWNSLLWRDVADIPLVVVVAAHSLAS